MTYTDPDGGISKAPTEGLSCAGCGDEAQQLDGGDDKAQVDDIPVLPEVRNTYLDTCMP